jgi:hypothetical protein
MVAYREPSRGPYVWLTSASSSPPKTNTKLHYGTVKYYESRTLLF